jgi:hypothetical protein
MQETDAIVPLARSLGGLLFWRHLEQATLQELWRVYRLVRGCHRLLKQFIFTHYRDKTYATSISFKNNINMKTPIAVAWKTQQLP